MNDLILIANDALVSFLGEHLPRLSSDWWPKLVVGQLSFQQQRILAERRHTRLEELDLAALLRVLDQNWYELSALMSLPREGRNWVKELQNVRNRWAHLAAQAVPPGDQYRDADTLERLLAMLNSEPKGRAAVEAFKAAQLARLAGNQPVSPQPPPADASQSDSVTNASEVPSPLFTVGQIVALRAEPEVGMPIVEVLRRSGEFRYRVFKGNGRATFYESQLSSFSEPATQVALNVAALQARLTGLHLLSPSTATLFSLRSGRINFVPYQYRPVLKMVRGDRPRLLIADEVGVGKTIEAGLILRELKARMEVASVLVLCPKALVAERKWTIELKRFDEHFIELDGDKLRHCLRETHLDGEWPPLYAKSIAPFSLFDSDLLFGRTKGRATEKGLLTLDPPPKFNLVIVDEAHHLRNSETFLHQGVKYFCDNADAVVLMTATPVQLGNDDLYTLLNLLRPDLVIDKASFGQMAAPNPFINDAVREARQGGRGWSNRARTFLDGAAATDWGRLFVRESPDFQKIYDRLGDENALPDQERIETIHDLEGLYTFSHIINRTRRRDIGDFTTRKPETIRVPFTSAQQQFHDDLLSIVARILVRCHGQINVKFLMTTIRRQAASCLYGLVPLLAGMLAGKMDRLELLETNDSDEALEPVGIDEIRADVDDLLRRAEALDSDDPKVDAFIRVLTDKASRPNNKSLVFSTFRHTLAYLHGHVQAQSALRVALVHGDVPDADRADIRRRFALPPDDTDAIDVMLSSEVGCEGLDFQFCDLLVNYDLPWNPMRVEQRIGRIDRYGQPSEIVAIVNLITPDTVDADIYDRCLLRIGVFEHAIGGSEEILGTISQELHDIGESFSLSPAERTARLQQLADNGIRRVREEADLEGKQADLFGLSVPSRSWREEIEAATSAWLSSVAIQRCVASYLGDRLGDGELILGDKPVKSLRLSHEARGILLDDYKKLTPANDFVSREWEKWLRGPLPTMVATFDQDVAVENVQAMHLSVVHPLVRQAAQHLEIREPVYTSVRLHSDAVRTGVYQFALYRWSMHGVKPDESLTAVSVESVIEDLVLGWLQSASVFDGDAAVPSESECEALDSRHYAKWTVAQANHIAANRQLVEHRIQSLAASHRARRRILEDQIALTANDKIRLMKESELARAESHYQQRQAELEKAAELGDVRATPVVFGTVTIEAVENR